MYLISLVFRLAYYTISIHYVVSMDILFNNSAHPIFSYTFCICGIVHTTKYLLFNDESVYTS